MLDQSSATDQDSYNVTAEFADANYLDEPRRPRRRRDPAHARWQRRARRASVRSCRPAGDVYGVTVGFSPPVTPRSRTLLAGTINIANVYSADPRIQTEDLVTLDDPEGLFLASNVVPLVNADIADSIADVINAVQRQADPRGPRCAQRAVDRRPEVVCRHRHRSG